MNIEFTFQQEANHLHIAGYLNIYTVAEAKTRMQSLAKATLDLSGITKFDGSGLQLLMVLHRDIGITITTANDTVTDVLQLAGQTGLMTPKSAGGGKA